MGKRIKKRDLLESIKDLEKSLAVTQNELKRASEEFREYKAIARRNMESLTYQFALLENPQKHKQGDTRYAVTSGYLKKIIIINSYFRKLNDKGTYLKGWGWAYDCVCLETGKQMCLEEDYILTKDQIKQKEIEIKGEKVVIKDLKIF